VTVTVKFHDQPVFDAEEIDDVLSDGNLASEFQISEASVAEDAPEPTFEVTAVLAKFACAVSLEVVVYRLAGHGCVLC
jgi:hypothetical protein